MTPANQHHDIDIPWVKFTSSALILLIANSINGSKDHVLGWAWHQLQVVTLSLILLKPDKVKAHPRFQGATEFKDRIYLPSNPEANPIDQ